MTIRSIQKVIKIGSSAGVTIPAKDMQHADIHPGDEVEVVVRKAKRDEQAQDNEVVAAAQSILKRYKKDFENLAKR
jgi:antitoxin component of MazEF toxin-antitoxin module